MAARKVARPRRAVCSRRQKINVAPREICCLSRPSHWEPVNILLEAPGPACAYRKYLNETIQSNQVWKCHNYLFVSTRKVTPGWCALESGLDPAAATAPPALSVGLNFVRSPHPSAERK
ncbi:hypothetical protein ACJJTC_007942 [Scirpophaga incertulas]